MYVFSELLKQFRVRQGMEQQELAHDLGVHRNTIIAWESSQNLPRTRKKVLDLARVLYLNEEDTDALLFAANYPLEYQAQEAEQALFTRIKVAKVNQMVVEHFVVNGDFTQNIPQTRSDYYAQISFPPNYIERLGVLTEVRRTLLAGNTSTVALTSAQLLPKPNALHGMGGIGKSVIARALCDDPEVQAAFPDGILWITLGQEPMLVSAMRQWINVLGGTINENAPTVDSLKATLAQLLKDRACLLILDDVWRRVHAEVFLIGGPRCHLMLTTRDAAIAHEIGAKIQPIPVMMHHEAIILLEEWAGGQLANIAPELIDQIVKRLGYLPLAVKLAGAQLRRKTPEEWLRTFNIRKLQSQRAEPGNIHDDLRQTFRISLKDLDEGARRLYVSLAIFKEDEAISEVGIKRLWEGLAGFDAEETADLIDDLSARALLDIIPLQGLRAIVLHDLLRDLIRLELGDNYVTLHQILLDVYRTTCQASGWHTAIDDGYLYNHLAYHLHTLGAVDEIKKLFADQQWLNARFIQSDHMYDGYLADLMFAMDLSQAETLRQIEANEELGAFADYILYLLIRTSINLVASNQVPELIWQAIKVGHWSVDRALSVAEKVSDVKNQVMMYVAVLRTGKLSPEKTREILNFSLRAVLALEDNIWDKAELLAALGPYLTGEMAEQALKASMALYNSRPRTVALMTLASHLSEECQEQAIKLAEEYLSIDYEEAEDLLNELAPYLTGKLLRLVLDTAFSFEDEIDIPAMVTLEALVPYLTRQQQAQLLELALSLEDEWEKVNALIALAPQFKEQHQAQILEQVLQLALSIEDGTTKASVLIALAPLLTEQQRTQVLEIALSLIDLRNMLDVLIALIPHLIGQQQAQILERALQIVESLKDKRAKVNVLIALAPHLTEQQRTKMLKQRLQLALSMKDRQTKANALITLAPLLPAEKQTEVLKLALDLVPGLKNTSTQTSFLKELAPLLRGELATQGLQIALSLLQYDKESVEVQVMPFLRAPVDVLVKLIPNLTDDQRIQLLRRALGAVQEVWVGYNLAEQHVYENERADKLLTLAPYLTGELLEQALKAALTLESDGEKHKKVLEALVSSKTGEGLDRGMKVALSLKNKWQQRELLATMAPYLTGELLEQALKAALERGDEWEEARVVANFAPQLRNDLHKKALGQALKLALALKDVSKKAEVLVMLVPHLTGKQQRQALEEALEAVLSLDGEFPWDVNRKGEYSDERARRLATLAPYLTEGLLEVGVNTARVWKYDGKDVLVTLAPYLKGKLLEVGVDAALALYDDLWEKAETLRILVPQLSGERCAEMLEISLEAIFAAEEERWFRKELLEDFVSRLKVEFLAKVLKIALALEDEGEKVDVLEALVSRLTDELREQALKAILALENESERVFGLAAFVPHLTGELRLQMLELGLKAALTLKDERERVDQLEALAPYLTDELRKWALEQGLRLEDRLNREEMPAVQDNQLTREERSHVLVRGVRDLLDPVNEWKRAEILKNLTPQLTGELCAKTLEQELEEILITHNVWKREKVLAEILPLVSDQTVLLKYIRQTMVKFAFSITEWSRQDVLQYFFIKEIFTLPIFSPEILGIITMHIIEICEEWRWL